MMARESTQEPAKSTRAEPATTRPTINETEDEGVGILPRSEDDNHDVDNGENDHQGFDKDVNSSQVSPSLVTTQPLPVTTPATLANVPTLTATTSQGVVTQQRSPVTTQPLPFTTPATSQPKPVTTQLQPQATTVTAGPGDQHAIVTIGTSPVSSIYRSPYSAIPSSTIKSTPSPSITSTPSPTITPTPITTISTVPPIRKLSEGAKAGLAVGVAILSLLTGIALVYVFCRRQTHRKNARCDSKISEGLDPSSSQPEVAERSHELDGKEVLELYGSMLHSPAEVDRAEAATARSQTGSQTSTIASKSDQERHLLPQAMRESRGTQTRNSAGRQVPPGREIKTPSRDRRAESR